MIFDSRFYILGDDGEPKPEADALKWARWLETADRIVARTDVGHGFVSTVFLGLDHDYFLGPPILWETMIFSVPGLRDYQRRYTSKLDAIAGHDEAVAMAQLAVQVGFL